MLDKMLDAFASALRLTKHLNIVQNSKERFLQLITEKSEGFADIFRRHR